MRCVRSLVRMLLTWRCGRAAPSQIDKYSEPVTSSQEVGWMNKPLVDRNPRFVYGLRQGESTQFAETYMKKMAGEHMYHGKSGKYLKF
jgi:hypothetical protein